MVPWRQRKHTAPWRRREPELDLPRSPFAERFYPANLPYWTIWEDGRLHSGLAPAHPSLDIYELTNIAAGPSENTALPKPNGPELDRLFLAERQQRMDLAGFPTWQVPALNAKPVGYDLREHIPRTFHDKDWEKYGSQLVSVDESKWLSNFKKQRWLDLREDCLKHISDPFPEMKEHSTNWWTVDNRVIWDNLRLSIEIANRILLQLMNERDSWLDAILFQHSEQWRYRDDNVHDLYDQNEGFDPIILEQVPLSQRATTAKMIEQWQECLECTVYTFLDETLMDFGCGITAMVKSMKETTRDKTTEDDEDSPCNVVQIHVGYLRALCNRDLSLPERTNVQIALTSTILHETMHALWGGRHVIEEYTNQTNGEPFMYPEIAMELGMSFETHVFGGPLQGMIFANDPYKLNGRTMALFMADWPTHHVVDRELPDAMISGTTCELPSFQYPIPAVWASAFMTESFWREVVSHPDAGSKAFRAPKLFRTEKHDDWYALGSRFFSAKRMRLPKEIISHKSAYEAVHMAYQDRKQHWMDLRPWYKDAYYTWSLSPWSMLGARTAVECFVEAHTRKDLAACITQARQFTSTRRRWNSGGDNAAMIWVYMALGHLMQASIPKMPKDHVESFPPQHHLIFYPNSLGPPKCMKDAGITEIDLDKVFTNGYVETDRVALSDWESAEAEVLNCLRMMETEKHLSPTPPAWMAALENALLYVRAECTPANPADAANKLDGWIDMKFEVPPYDDDMEWTRLQFGIGKGRMISPPTSPTGLLREASYAKGVFLDPDAKPLGPRMYKSAGKKLLSLKTDDDGDGKKPLRHYTIGEVGDHRGPNASVWAIKSDNRSGFDVYDITGICKEMKISDPRGFLLDVDLHGPALRVNGIALAKATAPWLQTLLREAELFDRMLGAAEGADIERIRAKLGSDIPPVGRLLISRRAEEIAEFDGRDGMPFWITIRGDVYDLTNFEMSKKEKTIVNSLIKPTRSNIHTELSAKAGILARIAPYKCAVVQQRPVKFLRTLRPFTPSMLRPHDNPTYGCFASIDGYVYNLNDYIEHHPGGRQILINCLGREATEFFDWHDAEIMDEFEHNRIGRLVPETFLDAIQKHQVVIHGWIFDISSLSPEQSSDKMHQWIHEKVAGLGGKDLSESIQGRDETASALAGLYQQKDHIVGKLPSQRKVADIPEEELKKHNDPNAAAQAWVEVDGLVYNVTPIMLHGRRFYQHDIPRIWAGTTLNDKTLGKWLAEDYAHLIVGKLVKGTAWPAPIGPDKEKLMRAKRAAELAGFLRPRKRPRSKIPDDINEWIRTKNPTAAQIRHRIAVRLGDYEDYTPEEGAQAADERMQDGTYEYPTHAPALKVRKMAKGFSASRRRGKR